MSQTSGSRVGARRRQWQSRRRGRRRRRRRRRRRHGYRSVACVTNHKETQQRPRARHNRRLGRQRCIRGFGGGRGCRCGSDRIVPGRGGEILIANADAIDISMRIQRIITATTVNGQCGIGCLESIAGRQSVRGEIGEFAAAQSAHLGLPKDGGQRAHARLGHCALKDERNERGVKERREEREKEKARERDEREREREREREERKYEETKRHQNENVIPSIID